MGVKLVPYSLFLIRKGIRNEKYVSFLIPYLYSNSPNADSLNAESPNANSLNAD